MLPHRKKKINPTNTEKIVFTFLTHKKKIAQPDFLVFPARTSINFSSDTSPKKAVTFEDIR